MPKKEKTFTSGGTVVGKAGISAAMMLLEKQSTDTFTAKPTAMSRMGLSKRRRMPSAIPLLEAGELLCTTTSWMPGSQLYISRLVSDPFLLSKNYSNYANFNLYYVPVHGCRACCSTNSDIPTLGMASKFFLNSAFIYFSLVFLPVCTSVLAVCTPAYTYV